MILAVLLAGALSLAPGLVLRSLIPTFWRPGERLFALIALSHAVSFAVAFPAIVWLRWSSSSIVVGLLVVGLIGLFDLVRKSELVSFDAANSAVLVMFPLLGMTAAVRTFGAAGWQFDWYEHYARSLFFLSDLPARWRIGPWVLAARPPLQNVLTALSIAHHPTLASYQLATTVFALPAVLAVTIIGPLLVGKSSPPSRIVLMLVAAPFFVNNTLYSWTKLLSAAYAAVAVAFYLEARRTWDPVRLGFCTLFLGLAACVHYSAIAFGIGIVVDVVLHLGRRDLRRRVLAAFAPRRLMMHVATVFAVFGTWLVWSIQRSGAALTFGATTTTQGSTRLVAVVGRVATNVTSSFLPLNIAKLGPIPGSSRLDVVRSWWFYCTQASVLGGLGLLGSAALVSTVVHLPDLRRRLVRCAPLLGISVAVACGTHPSNWNGVTQVVLQPLWILGLGLAVTANMTRRRFALLAMADFVFVGIHVQLLSIAPANSSGSSAVDSTLLLRRHHLRTVAEVVSLRQWLAAFAAASVVCSLWVARKRLREATPYHLSITALAKP